MSKNPREFHGTLDGGSDYPKWEEGGGVRFSRLQTTVNEPTNFEWLDFEGMLTRLLVRHVDRGANSYTTHVVCHEVGDVLQVSSAVKVYDDLQPGIKDMKPLDMLLAFVTKLNMPPIFYEREAFRLLAMYTFPLKRPGVFEIGLGEQKGDLQTIAHHRLSEDKRNLYVNLGWVMNFTTYRQYLAAHV